MDDEKWQGRVEANLENMGRELGEIKVRLINIEAQQRDAIEYQADVRGLKKWITWLGGIVSAIVVAIVVQFIRNTK